VPEVETLLTMGQWLSILPMLIGAVLLVWCIARPVPTRPDGPAAPLPVAPAPAKPSPARSRRRKRNH
jgi:prolipoprotein diacylglyceryltransferase